MDLGLTDTVAIVTGGASGIGRATASTLAAEGARVAILDRDAELAQTAASELLDAGHEAVGIGCDVANEASIQEAIAQVHGTWQRIDALLCCAGVSGLYGKPITDISVADWDHMMGVNIRGQWLPVKHALPHLRNSPQAAVVIIASDSGLAASPLHVPYCASKGAVVMLTKALAVDLRDEGVRVNCVCPSIVDTGMARADMGLPVDGLSTADYPVHRPEDIARYMTLLASPATQTINAHPLVADFGYLAQSNFPA